MRTVIPPPTPELRALLEACLADPTACLIVGDWFEERGNDRAAACMRWAAKEGKWPDVRSFWTASNLAVVPSLPEIQGWWYNTGPEHANIGRLISGVPLYSESVADAWLSLIEWWRESGGVATADSYTRNVNL